MEENKGKQVLDELEKASKVERQQWCLGETPLPGIGEAFSGVVGGLVGEAVETTMETVATVDEAARTIEEALKVPRQATEIVGEVAKMEVGYGTISAMDQAASGVHRTPSEASDGCNVVEVTSCLQERARLQGGTARR